MTMPFERTRALRWAGEFLEKLNLVAAHPEKGQGHEPWLLPEEPK